MEQDKTTVDIQKYVRPLLRRKWLWIIPTIIFSIGFAHNAVNKPDIYESRCVLFLENSRLINTVLEDRDAKLDTGKVLEVVSERMLGWESVVKVIRKLELDRYIPEDDPGALEGLYKAIVNNITLTQKGRGGNKITITCRGTNPEVNYNIVNGLVSNFMDESLKLTQAEANETIAFIEEDIEQIKRKFDKSERKLHKFEEEHRSELPESKDNNISRLSSAENELAAIDREIIILQERIGFVEDHKYMTTTTEEGVQIFTSLGSNLSQQIIDLEIHIEMLQAKYFDEHPEIVMRKNELAQLKEVLKRESDKVVTEEGNSSVSVLTEREFGMQLQLKSLQKRREETENLIASLGELITNMPNYNLEYFELQKAYSINEQLYEQRFLQKSKVELVQNMSRNSKANPFSIIEPARIPKEPLKAHKIGTMLMGLVVGVGLGIGMIFGLERTDQRFKTIGDVQGYLQVPALGVIPTILTKTDIRRKIRKKIVTASLLAVFVISAVTVSFVVQPVKDVVQPVKDVVNNDITKIIKLIKGN